MSQIKYVHVWQYEDGERFIGPGKGDRSGTHVLLPTPDNGLEDMQRREYERVDYWKLPEPMPKSEFQDWWNEHKDDDVEPIPEVVECVRAEEEADDAATEGDA